MKKNNRFTLAILLVLISVLAFTGCSSTPSQSNETSTPADGEVEEIVTVTVNHELGQAVVNKNPQRVIVFDYATLDSLDALGIEVIGLPKSNIPAYLSKFNDDKYEDVGTLFEPDFEKIFSMEPDLILISGRQRDVYPELEKIAPTVFLTVDTSDYVGSLTDNVTLLGEIFGKEVEAAAELKKVTDSLEAVGQKVADLGKNALIIMANEGNLSAYGPGSRFGIIHNEFAFIAADEEIEIANHGMNVSYEYIVEKDPDYILVIDRGAVTAGNASSSQLFDNDLMKQTQAIQNDNMIYLNSHVWYVASGGLIGTSIMIQEIEDGIK